MTFGGGDDMIIELGREPVLLDMKENALGQAS
jgi:hypothetical protein